MALKVFLVHRFSFYFRNIIKKADAFTKCAKETEKAKEAEKVPPRLRSTQVKIFSSEW